MREVKEIIIHCSATPEGMEVDAAKINEWHKKRGWAGIGYHYVIKLDGTIEKGRDEDTIGSHAYGHNKFSIGVCYIGGLDKDMKPKDTRTEAQKIAMKELIEGLYYKYRESKIIGHNEVSEKACPSFDVQKWVNEEINCNR